VRDRFHREITVGSYVFFDRDGFSFPVVEIQEPHVRVDHPYNAPKWFFDTALAVDPTPTDRRTYREKLYGTIRVAAPADDGKGEKEMDLIDIHNKAEAVAFVAAVMQNGLALLSPNFQLAMDASRAFDISVQDVLEFRREKARRA